MGDKGSLSIDMMKLHEVMPPTEDDSKGSSESRLAAAGVQSAFKKLEIKKGWCKTLAKPMHYHRLLNCRASGLLEQSDAPKSASSAFCQWKDHRADLVIRNVSRQQVHGHT